MNTELNFPRRLLVAVVSQNNIGSLRRQLQRCGEQPHHRKKHEGAEDRNAYFVRQTHVTAPSE